MNKTIRVTDCLVVVLSSLVLGCAKDLPELPPDIPYVPASTPEASTAAQPIVEPALIVPSPVLVSAPERLPAEPGPAVASPGSSLPEPDLAVVSPVVPVLPVASPAVTSPGSIVPDLVLDTEVSYEETFKEAIAELSEETYPVVSAEVSEETYATTRVVIDEAPIEEASVDSTSDFPLVFVANDLVKALSFISGMDPAETSIRTPTAGSQFDSLVKNSMLQLGYQFDDRRGRTRSHQLTTSYLESDKEIQPGELIAIMALNGVLIKRTYTIQNDTVEAKTSYVIRGIKPDRVDINDQVSTL